MSRIYAYSLDISEGGAVAKFYHINSRWEDGYNNVHTVKQGVDWYKMAYKAKEIPAPALLVCSCGHELKVGANDVFIAFQSKSIYGDDRPVEYRCIRDMSHSSRAIADFLRG